MKKVAAVMAVIFLSCAVDSRRVQKLSDEKLKIIVSKAQDVRFWAPLCNGYPSAENCNTGDSMATTLGLLCSVNFKLACDGVNASISDNGQVRRAPGRVDEDNSSSRDQFVGYLAAAIVSPDKWLSVKRYVKEHKELCSDATDSRCELTPVTIGLMAMVHGYLGYEKDSSMLLNEQILPSVLLSQARLSPTGYQLHLVSLASYIAWKTGHETNLTYEAAKVAFERQKENPFFCFVVYGASEQCADLALKIWPIAEPQFKKQWSLMRDTEERAWLESQGWEFLFLAGLFGVDLNSLYSSSLEPITSTKTRN